jgi:hypothetical protein
MNSGCTARAAKATREAGIQRADQEAMKFIYLLALAGGYVAWRNRFAIQRFLESEGIGTPTFGGGVGESAQSVASKVAGKVEHGLKVYVNQIDSAEEQNVGNR